MPVVEDILRPHWHDLRGGLAWGGMVVKMLVVRRIDYGEEVATPLCHASILAWLRAELPVSLLHDTHLA